jgi:uncharacterized protein (DUF2461 family)
VLYDGIFPEALHLLAENRFRDSHAFYEENKARLQSLAVNPLRQVAAALCPQLAALDGEMQLVPGRMVSRIRRDTRFTKEKQFYRSNLWINFRRALPDTREAAPPPTPYFWFEIRPEEDDWSCGVCPLYASPAFMRFFRERILKNPQAFLDTLAVAQSKGATPEIDVYKKQRYPDAAEALRPWLNAKTYCLIYRQPGLEILRDHAILDALCAQFAVYAPHYKWLLAAARDFLIATEGDTI